MYDIESLRTTVQNNCHISDARYAGHNSLCIFLLKMREYFRWESGLGYDDHIPRTELADWLSAREALWDEVEAQDFAPLVIAGAEFDPFDSEAINRRLLPVGLVYSAGYGQWAKPHFVLAELEHHQTRDGFHIHISGRELARDLIAPPAMTQNSDIFVRRESLQRLLWERVQEWTWGEKSSHPEALATYDFSVDPVGALQRMTDHELHSVTLHELGEGVSGRRLGPDWRELVTQLPRCRAELLARSAKDHLADCLVTLPTLLDEGNDASIHFFFANLTAMRRSLFPGLASAYQQWLIDADPAPLRALAATGVIHWEHVANRMLDEFRAAPDGCNQRIEALEALFKL